MKQLTILSAEDNYGDQKLIELALELSGSQTVLKSVENGAEVLSFLRRLGKFEAAPRPDLILMDLNLPKMTGLEVMAAVKLDPTLRDIPMVILTGAEAPSEMGEISGSPGFYIVKPDEPDAFFAVVRAIDEYARAMAEVPEKSREHAARLKRLRAA